MDQDELSLLAYKYKADKCPQLKHTYTPYYYELLKDRKNVIKKVLEIGTAEGASMFMWRAFFPKAQIYGAEIDPARVALMEGQERIAVVRCDQTSEADLKNVILTTGPDLDLVIDDGSHVAADQIFSCKKIMPLLQKHAIYIIEDCQLWHSVSGQLKEYDVEIPTLTRNRWKKRDNYLVVVRHKAWPKSVF